MALFQSAGDYRAFLPVVGQTLRLAPMRVCGFVLIGSGTQRRPTI